MKNLTIRLFLYICIALVPISCGVRKVQAEINKTGTSDKQKEQSESAKESESKTISQLESSQVKGKIKENTEITTTTKYDKDTGKPTETTTTTKTGKTVSNSYKKRNERTEAYLRIVEKLKTVTIREVKSYTYDKTKNTQRSNNGIYVMLGAVLVFGILVLAVYKYITRVRKVIPASE